MEGLTDCEGSPEDFSPVLVGCSWQRDGNVHLVLDPAGRSLGRGLTRRAAAILASNSRRAELLLPGSYHDCLEGCVFGVRAEPGGASALSTVLDDRGAEIACALTRRDAALDAARFVLRQRAVASMTLSEFWLLATVVTVDLARGKSGKAAHGTPYLKVDVVIDPQAHARLLDALTRSIKAKSHTPPLYSDLLSRRANDAQQLLADCCFDGPIRPVRLDNGEWIVLRKPAAPAAKQCLGEAYRAIVQERCDHAFAWIRGATPAADADGEDSPPHSEDGHRPRHR